MWGAGQHVTPVVDCEEMNERTPRQPTRTLRARRPNSLLTAVGADNASTAALLTEATRWVLDPTADVT